MSSDCQELSILTEENDQKTIESEDEDVLKKNQGGAGLIWKERCDDTINIEKEEKQYDDDRNHESFCNKKEEKGSNEEENQQPNDQGGGGGEEKEAAIKSSVNDDAAPTTTKKQLQEEEEDDESWHFRLALGCRQFVAFLHKNLLIKFRTPLSTCMEILSPVFMMLVLVLAYNLYDEAHNVEGQTYSVLEFQAPGPWIDLFTTSMSAAVPFIMAKATTTGAVPANTLSRRQTARQRKLQELFSEPGDDDDDDDKELWWLTHDYKKLWSPDWLLNLVRLEQEQRQGPTSSLIRRLVENSDQKEDTTADTTTNTTTLDVDNDDIDMEMDIFALLEDGLNIMRRMLRSPIVIPTLEQYLQLHTALSSIISVDNVPQMLHDSQFLLNWGNLLLLGTLHLSPSHSAAARAFEAYIMLNTNSTVINNLKIHWHDSEDMAVQYINDHIHQERTWALIDFTHWPNNDNNDNHHNDNNSIHNKDDDDDLASLQVKYKIRMNVTVLPDTHEIINYVTTGLDRTYERYYLSGYLTLQQTLNDFAFDYFNASTTSTTAAALAASSSMCGENRPKNIWSMPMPTAMYTQNDFFLQVGYLLGLTMVMAFLYPVSRLIKSIVEEKEMRLRETFYILGVEPWAHFCSSLCMACIMFVVTALLVTLILSNHVLKYSNPMLLLAWIVLFLTATMGFCFCIAALFSKAKLASIIGPMAFFATILPRFIFFGSNRYEAATQKTWASLLPATAFAFGSDIVADYEYSQKGVQTWNRSEGAYSFDTCLTMLFWDTILYIFLAWYLDQVMPREFGTPRPVWFLFSPHYWCSGMGSGGDKTVTSLSRSFSPRPGDGDDVRITDEGSIDLASSNDNSSDDVEEFSANHHEKMTDPSLVPQIKICKLTKQYNKRNIINKKHSDGDMPPPAVNQLNLDLYESQITTLLGHNGAGKTTVISILTGLFSPTSGDASIYGHSIVKNTAKARRSIGICPQQNVLVGRLTVLEHICFFTRIKGIRGFTMEQAKDRALEIGLGEFLYTTAAALSGGNKRKLCVAVALCGDPKFLILDEPTSGMDPCARRSVWELLRRKRLGRSILLSTHFMQEAELLSDRIAVLRNGNLLCSGSPLFLKNRHGLGYNFTAVIEVSSSSSGSASAIYSSADNLLSVIRRYVPEADIARIGGKEVTIRFPPGNEDVFPACFDELETQRDSMQIGAFGIQNASLEEVFISLAEESDDMNRKSTHLLRVGEEDQVLEELSESRNANSGCDSSANRDPESTTLPDSINEQWENQYMSPLQQLWLLYGKRVTVQKRDPKGLCFAIVVPAILVALSLFVLTIDLAVTGPSIELSPSLYQLSNNGKAALTDVLVGGGISFRQSQNVSEATALIAPMYESLRDNMEKQYPHVEFDRVESNLSSDQVSEFLYNSINAHDHHMRYGAFVLNDAIMTKLVVNWSELFDDLDAWFAALASDESSPSTIQLSNSFVRDVFYNVTTLLPDTLVNVSEITNFTVAMLDAMFADSNISRTDFQDQHQDSRTALYNESGLEDIIGVGVLNSSIIDPLIQWLDGSNYSFDFDILGLWARDVSVLIGEEDVSFSDVVSFLMGTTEKIDPQSGPLSALFTIAIIELDARLRQEDVADKVLTLEEILELANELPLFNTSETIDTITLYPSMATLNIAFNGNATAILGQDSFSLNVSLDDLREIAPQEKTTYNTEIPTDASILHNASSPHAVASFNQAFTESLFKQCTGQSSARLISENHPLPLTTQQNIEIKTALSVLAVMFVLIPFCYIPGAFVVFQVKEKSCKSKHLQLVSGVNLTSYWISSYFYDMTLYLALTILVMIVFLLYGKDAAQVFVGDTESFLCTLTLTFGYGVSCFPYSYLLARRFSNHSSAQIAVIALVFLTGFIAVNAYFIMLSMESTAATAQALRPLFRCWPPFLVGEGLIMMVLAYWRRGIWGSDSRPFNWEIAGKPIVLLYSLAIPYFMLLLALEYSQDGGAGGIIGRILRSARDTWEMLLLRIHGVKQVNGTLTLNDGLLDDKDVLDDDVLAEERRVNENSAVFKQTAPIMYLNLWKVYPPSVGLLGSMMASSRQFLGRFCCCKGVKAEEQRRAYLPKRAVRGVSTVVEEGETFALLGENGAGKSSTLGVLTGDVSATLGQVYIAGHDATGKEERNGVTLARRHIGFCPQVDPLLDLMTARETLRMYGSLRGIPVKYIDGKVESLLEQLSLTPHADKPAQSLSGGNKRKLSLGIALIGDPKVLLIDESSSGMDPLAKRRMWNLIAEVSKNRTVITTTHSMEEAEALCTRAGIMSSGRLLCHGTVQHLKTKYLDGYTIDVFCDSGSAEEEIGSVVNEILETALPGCKLSERYGRFLRFDVPSLSSLGLGTTFRHMQALKTSPLFCVENYSISQCSLEQVFVKLVEQATLTSGTGDETIAAVGPDTEAQ